MISPISGIVVNSSTVAFIKLSRSLYFLANILAVLAPTWGIPKPNNNLSREFLLLSSIAFKRLVTDLSP